MTEWLKLEDKVVVVTGAAGGMGSKFSEDFAAQGANLVLMDMSAERVAKLANDLTEKYGVKTLPLTANVTDESQVDNAVAKTV